VARPTFVSLRSKGKQRWRSCAPVRTGKLPIVPNTLPWCFFRLQVVALRNLRHLFVYIAKLRRKSQISLHEAQTLFLCNCSNHLRCVVDRNCFRASRRRDDGSSRTSRRPGASSRIREGFWRRPGDCKRADRAGRCIGIRGESTPTVDRGDAPSGAKRHPSPELGRPL
jgi:hypothetical protein